MGNNESFLIFLLAGMVIVNLYAWFLRRVTRYELKETAIEWTACKKACLLKIHYVEIAEIRRPNFIEGQTRSPYITKFFFDRVYIKKLNARFPILISPDNPDEFVKEVKRRMKLAKESPGPEACESEAPM